MMYDKIPEDLKQLNQWVCANDCSKVPMQANRPYAASSTDPTTWASFEDALWAVEHDYFDYLGFVFDDNGIIGIDIDIGYGEDGRISDLARDILAVTNSYTERSRSGRGFHIFVKGDLPFKGKNNLAGVEIYKASRFFIMTGDVLNDRPIREDQSAIDYILQKYFPETRESKSTKVAPRIYNPEWDSPKGKQRVRVRPNYPRIPDGCRNICLTSLAGMMHSIGYSKNHIYKELQYANDTACDPPLSVNELRSICNSVVRYRR
jgi:primase-polymerase (primpol)-like protein